MKQIAFLLLTAATISSMAQMKQAPVSVKEVSPFKTAAVDALACLVSLKDSILENKA
jgi:hypothetical protein